MITSKTEQNVLKMISLVDMYGSLANKKIKTEQEVVKTKTEMKVIKESLLNLIIDTKKGLRKIETKSHP